MGKQRFQRILVPENGVEPSRPCGHRILSPARLPVPPLGHNGSIASPESLVQLNPARNLRSNPAVLRSKRSTKSGLSAILEKRRPVDLRLVPSTQVLAPVLLRRFAFSTQRMLSQVRSWRSSSRRLLESATSRTQGKFDEHGSKYLASRN